MTRIEFTQNTEISLFISVTVKLQEFQQFEMNDPNFIKITYTMQAIAVSLLQHTCTQRQKKLTKNDMKNSGHIVR